MKLIFTKQMWEGKEDTIFFTADFHLNHFNILRLAKRPFKDLDEMHDTIKENWNNVVPENGITFNLGDLSWDNPKWTADYMSSLNGEKYFVIGNHDKIACDKKVSSVFKSARDFNGNEVKILESIKLVLRDFNGDGDDLNIIMYHYPTASWENMYRGSWMLHGHCHNNFKMNLGKCVDVGIDAQNYTPVSLRQLVEIMKSKPVKDNEKGL